MAKRGQRDLPEGWEGLGVPAGGREAISEGWEWLGGPLGWPGGVSRLSRRPGNGHEALPVGQEAFPMGQEALPVDWEALLMDRVWSGCPFSGSRVVWKPSRLDGSGPEAIAEGREWLGGTPGEPGVVGRPPEV